MDSIIRRLIWKHGYPGAGRGGAQSPCYSVVKRLVILSRKRYGYRVSSDQELKLIRRCREGENDAWDELFSQYYPMTARFVFQLTASLTREDVEEICQETFLAVVRSLRDFQGNCQFHTWLYRIAANKTRDYVERQKAAKRGGGQVPISLQAEDENGLTLDPASPAPAPDLQAMGQEQMELLSSALHALGDPCREMIELRYFADLSYDEIANALRLNPKTVSSRLSRCLDRLEAMARPMLNREKSISSSV
jgi:RNA polymerase sigma-70 factor (ECF subfamily)